MGENAIITYSSTLPIGLINTFSYRIILGELGAKSDRVADSLLLLGLSLLTPARVISSTASIMLLASLMVVMLVAGEGQIV